MQLSSAFICCQGWENNLVWELKRKFPNSSPETIFPGLVLCKENPALFEYDPIFCRQLLPHVQIVRTSSAKKIIGEILDYVVPILQDSESSWAYHIATPDFFQENGRFYRPISSRIYLLERLFLEEIKHFWPHLLKRCISCAGNKKSANTKNLFLIQCIFTTKENCYWSISKPATLSNGRCLPILQMPWQMPNDEQAPCRSYYKLEEAWNELGFSPTPGNLCVDLGAAPGGWTWAILKRGAIVQSVDVANLKDHVAQHPKCQHLRENAFSFIPSQPVDWLVCDIIAKPLASVGILERWLGQKLCKNFAVAVKFRGNDTASLIENIEKMLAPFRLHKRMIRHLYYNHNEITLLGSV